MKHAMSMKHLYTLNLMEDVYVGIVSFWVGKKVTQNTQFFMMHTRKYTHPHT